MLMSESNPPLRKKKVLVSGCFDLLHSGHVEFFREAAKLGDLYVRVGSDANIRLLKQHAPMFSEKERLFMVQNIRCVHDAAVSVGKGRFDFFEDAKLVKPDIYFVNEDASELQARLDFCAEVHMCTRKDHIEQFLLTPRFSRCFELAVHCVIIL